MSPSLRAAATVFVADGAAALVSALIFSVVVAAVVVVVVLVSTADSCVRLDGGSPADSAVAGSVMLLPLLLPGSLTEESSPLPPPRIWLAVVTTIGNADVILCELESMIVSSSGLCLLLLELLLLLPSRS